jgi:hypothetical protein
VSCCREFEVVDAKGRDRSRKTWSECVKTDMRSLGLKEWAQDRMERRRLIVGKTSKPRKHGNTDAKLETMMMLLNKWQLARDNIADADTPQ